MQLQNFQMERINPKTSLAKINSAFYVTDDYDLILCINRLIDLIQKCNPNVSNVTFATLMAVQVNFHNGVSYLPFHFDDINSDGFGHTICTLTLWDNATVLVGEERSSCFVLEQVPGDFYVLADYARNSCCHGVLCSISKEKKDPRKQPHGRVSLNFRFGIAGI